MTDDELVERFFPCERDPGCCPSGQSHSIYCEGQRDKARRLAAAVREAVLKRVRVCGACEGRGRFARQRMYADQTSGSDGLYFVICSPCLGRGVVKGET